MEPALLACNSAEPEVENTASAHQKAIDLVIAVTAKPNLKLEVPEYVHIPRLQSAVVVIPALENEFAVFDCNRTSGVKLIVVIFPGRLAQKSRLRFSGLNLVKDARFTGAINKVQLGGSRNDKIKGQPAGNLFRPKIYG